MIGKVWLIAAKDLRQLSKDRGTLLMMFVVPLLLIGLLGSALGDTFGGDKPVTASIPVVDHDRGPEAQELLAVLRRMPNVTVRMRSNEAVLRQDVRDGAE